MHHNRSQLLLIRQTTTTTTLNSTTGSTSTTTKATGRCVLLCIPTILAILLLSIVLPFSCIISKSNKVTAFTSAATYNTNRQGLVVTLHPTRTPSTVQQQNDDDENSNDSIISTAASTTTTMLNENDKFVQTLTNTANSYAAAHGIQVETKQQAGVVVGDPSSTTTSVIKTYQMAPISLLPQAYPRSSFTKAIAIAPYFNQLVHSISNDPTFLIRTLGGIVSQNDGYTAKLLQLYLQIYYPTMTKASTSGNSGSSSDTDMTTITKFAHSADQLGIIRSDYMLHRTAASALTSATDTNNNNSNNLAEAAVEYTIKQVELNTIASSFAGLAHTVAKLHAYLIARYDNTTDTIDNTDHTVPVANNALNEFLMENQKAMVVSSSSSSSTTTTNKNEIETVGVPHNPTLERLPLAMNLAVQRYKERFLPTSTTQGRCGILFVVQEGETNTVDQRLLEFQLWDLYQIPVVRLSMSQIYQQVQRNKVTGALTVETGSSISSMEIALVYYRAGYAPTDYPSGYDGIEWLAREMMEGSRATKCPSLGYHLAGTKKVQQELSRPGRLEHYFPKEPMVVDQLRAAFAGLYSLGDDANDSDMDAVHDVLINKNYDKYVLKPQREGGGYNFYGQQMLHKLQENVTITPSESGGGDDKANIALSDTLGEYILMERLFPPQQNAILLRGGKVEGIGLTISELGCFGTILAAGRNSDTVATTTTNNDDGTILHNEYAGFLLRTKFSNVDEGGVASGFATLSSPYLF